jgi:hypothetical protein
MLTWRPRLKQRTPGCTSSRGQPLQSSVNAASQSATRLAICSTRDDSATQAAGHHRLHNNVLRCCSCVDLLSGSGSGTASPRPPRSATPCMMRPTVPVTVAELSSVDSGASTNERNKVASCRSLLELQPCDRWHPVSEAMLVASSRQSSAAASWPACCRSANSVKSRNGYLGPSRTEMRAVRIIHPLLKPTNHKPTLAH